MGLCIRVRVGVGAYVGTIFPCGFECCPYSAVSWRNIGSGVVVDDGVGSSGGETGVCLDGYLSLLCGAVATGLSDT